MFVLRHAGQDLRQDLPLLGKRRLAVRMVRAPHHVVDADDVAQANADGVLPREEAAREQAVLEPINRLAVPLAGLTRAQREHGFRHPVDHAQKGAGRTLRQRLPLFPTAHRRNGYANPARELGL
jgi:hypothetical protein